MTPDLIPVLGFSLAQALQPMPTASFLLQGFPQRQVQLEQITYLGDCPGEEQRELKGVSFLATARPAPYQRIVIQNQTTGGYTDREYDERRPSSQTFSMALGQGQRGSFLTLAPGMNSFTYQVRQRLQNLVVDQGTASLQVGVNRISQNRGFQEIREDTYCSGEKSRSSRTPLKACPNGLITLERIGVCPGGRTTTLSLESLGGGYRPGGWNSGGQGSWGGGGGGGGWMQPR